MFKLFIVLYFEYIVSIISHEVFHFITAKIMGFTVHGIYLGESLFRMKIGKVYISPIIKDGFVEVSFDKGKSANKIKIGAFFLSGMIANIILIWIGCFMDNSILGGWLVVNNVVILVWNLLPFSKNNDCSMFLKYVLLRDNCHQDK